jgi:peptide/nickel transport system substrate-binding protein
MVSYGEASAYQLIGREGKGMGVFRSFLRPVTMVVLLLSGAVACTGGDGSSVASSSSGAEGTDCGTLEMAFNFDMQVPDPDIFYQADGLNVTQGAYEGLLRYVPNSDPPAIGPSLAESYTISPDGLTYTFKLRQGVKFHDGTDFNAQAMVYDFQRRADVNAGPAFYSSYIVKSETPDPYTLILHLKEPNQAFIGMVASPYGFKAVSPTAIKKHEVNGDFAQGWLATHSAGTGPYFYSRFEPGDYELTRFDDYWGTAPDFSPACFEKVHIQVIPDFTTQQLQLESGGLNLMIHGVGKNDVPRFEGEGFSIFRTFGIDFVVMHLNTESGPFSDPAVRAAVPQALDRQAIVDQVWGDGAAVANQIWPKGTIPADMGTYDVTMDPSKLAAAVQAGGWGDATVDLAYTTDDPVNEQLAGLIAAQLTSAGLKTSTRGVTQPETFTYPTKPNIRPDALVLPATPDAIDAWSWSDLFYRDGGGLSYFSPTVCTHATDLTVEGVTQADQEKAYEIYAQAAAAFQDCGAYVPIADVAETIVGAPGMTGFEHEPDSLWALRLASLRWSDGSPAGS